MKYHIWPALCVGTWAMSVCGLTHFVYTIENNKKIHLQRFLKDDGLSNKEINAKLSHLWGPELKSK